MELVCPEPASEAKVNFALDRLNILLHVVYRRRANQLVFNRRDPTGWQSEMVVLLPVDRVVGDSLPASLYLSINPAEADGTDDVLVRWRGGEARPHWVCFSDLAGCATWLEGCAAWHQQGAEPRVPWQDWRLSRRPSGFPAGSRPPPPAMAGAGFLIRAKNEAPTVQACLRSIAGLADEIVFVDNDSSDATRNLAEQLKSECFELKTFSYPHRIPRAGAEHAAEVFGGGTNTLGHFYNWCLAQAGCRTVIKWDADYIALRGNLAEMIRRFDLRTRGDNFVLWFSGLEVYTDGVRFWVDQHSTHSEFRAFSRRPGHHWVNLPPWEEMDQGMLFRAQKLFFGRPVYLELFRLDEIEFRDRGLFADDTRDRERLGYIRTFRDTGEVPAHFLPIDGLDDARLEELPLSGRETAMACYFDSHFRCLPATEVRASQASTGPDMLRQDDLAVLVISCARNTARQEAIRETWGAGLERLGIPWLFVVGRPGQEARIIGDTLFLDVPDSYEFLASKIAAAMVFSLQKMNVDYVFKIDDDCVLLADRLLSCTFRDADFTGGGLAGGPDSANDWHAGKCANPQIDRTVHFRAPGRFWIGGQFGYFLSRAAREVLAREQAALRRSLYEDYAVSALLTAHGMAPRWPFGDFHSVKYADGTWMDRTDVVLVADTPDAAAQRTVHAAFERGAALDQREAALRVRFDWMDFERARHSLTGGPSADLLPPPQTMVSTLRPLPPAAS